MTPKSGSPETRASFLTFGAAAALQHYECYGQQGKQRQTAPEIHERVKPGLKKRGGDDDESDSGSPETEWRAQGESRDICGGALAAEVDVGEQRDQPRQDHAGEGRPQHVAEGILRREENHS